MYQRTGIPRSCAAPSTRCRRVRAPGARTAPFHPTPWSVLVRHHVPGARTWRHRALGARTRGSGPLAHKPGDVSPVNDSVVLFLHLTRREN